MDDRGGNLEAAEPAGTMPRTHGAALLEDPLTRCDATQYLRGELIHDLGVRFSERRGSVPTPEIQDVLAQILSRHRTREGGHEGSGVGDDLSRYGRGRTDEDQPIDV